MRYKSLVSSLRLKQGFTLVEMVVVILITAIVAAITVTFIRQPLQAYADSEARVESSEAAEMTLNRMVQDLQKALPNSIRTTTDGINQYIEFLPTKIGGRYLADSDFGATTVTGDTLDFTTASRTDFEVVGVMPSNTDTLTTISSGDFVVVNNRGQGYAGPGYAYDAYDCGTKCNRATVTSASGNTISLSSNPFSSITTADLAPGNHFQVTTATPVSYVCSPATGSLTRYWGYAIAASQPNSIVSIAGASSGLLAQGVTACSFSYDATSALLSLSLTFRVNGESVRVFHQVHVDNVP